MKRHLVALTVFTIAMLSAGLALGFTGSGGGCESDCKKCHSISAAEATDLVRQINPEIEVVGISNGPVGGLWELTVLARGRKGLAYVDFAKQHIITGSIIEVHSKANVTESRLYDITKVDFAAIPLRDAIVLGNPEAKNRVIVFDDPD